MMVCWRKFWFSPVSYAIRVNEYLHSLLPQNLQKTITLFSDSNMKNMPVMFCGKAKLLLNFHPFCSYPCFHLHYQNISFKVIKMCLTCPNSPQIREGLWPDHSSLALLYLLLIFRISGPHPGFRDFIHSSYLEPAITCSAPDVSWGLVLFPLS